MTVDDLLVEDGRVAPFSTVETSHAAMGRYGNVFLTSGDPDLRLAARAGEVVRLWLTNTANTRVFNLAVPGARMKLVGGDSGRVEHQELVQSVVLALVAQLDDPAALPADAGPVTYACPMHPEVTSDQPGRCPQCGMKLLAAASVPKPAAPDAAALGEDGGHAQGHDHDTMNHQAMNHQAMNHGAHPMGHDHDMGHGTADGIEWEDDMVQVNRLTTTATMHWKFLDRTSGADSPTIDWQFTVGHGSSSGWSTRWTPTTPCTTPSTSMGRAGSWSFPGTGWSSPTWSGRTPCWSAPARPSTSCSTCPTPAYGWPTATSPSTCRAA